MIVMILGNLDKLLELSHRTYLLSSSRCGYTGPIIPPTLSPTRDVILSSTTKYGSAMRWTDSYEVIAHDGFRIQLARNEHWLHATDNLRALYRVLDLDTLFYATGPLRLCRRDWR